MIMVSGWWMVMVVNPHLVNYNESKDHVSFVCVANHILSEPWMKCQLLFMESHIEYG
jgi:hypothetical protein